MNQISLLKPSPSEVEINALAAVLRSSWWGTGPRVEEFERRFAELVGVKYCVAVNSCTSALHLALRETMLRDKQFPNIVTTPLTFVSTALVALYEGVHVRFADIDERTLCLDPQQVNRLIDEDTVAVLPVHYAGNIADITYADRVNVIEDCAHAGGSISAGKKGHSACWSFHPVKNIATGDMGAITTNNEALYRKLIPARWCGINLDTWSREKSGYNWEYDISTIGFKYNTNDIMATLALVQMGRLEKLNGRRKEIADVYKKELVDLPIILPQVESETWHLFVIRVPSYLRNQLVEHLRSNNISPGVHYKPLHHYPIFKGEYHLPVTDRIYPELLSLPIHPDLTEEEQEKVINVIKKFFKKG